jgi:hypothetical protein
MVFSVEAPDSGLFFNTILIFPTLKSNITTATLAMPPGYFSLSDSGCSRVKRSQVGARLRRTGAPGMRVKKYVLPGRSLKQ